ncbi:MAG: symbB [Caulobacter sp.]|jgi:hypothetical protein|nr:symbB [Caulobacter sp.]
MIMARLKGLMSPVAALKLFYPGDKAPAADFDPSTASLEIADARAAQDEAVSAPLFFQERGFALIDHVTTVRDWSRDPAAEAAAARIYRLEIEAIVRDRLFPGRPLEIDHQLKLVRRGGAEDAVYADWVHQDFGLAAGDFARNLAGIATPDAAEAWRARYDRDDVIGCVVISCWRTIGMREPLRHMPLALCDPTSVEMADVIEIAPGSDGAGYHIGLRHNAGQRWYSYPGMSGDELLAFKLFECRKDDPRPERLRSVFHAAFEDPGAPPDAKRRQSCEYRVIVMLLAD